MTRHVRALMKAVEADPKHPISLALRMATESSYQVTNITKEQFSTLLVGLEKNFAPNRIGAMVKKFGLRKARRKNGHRKVDKDNRPRVSFYETGDDGKKKQRRLLASHVALVRDGRFPPVIGLEASHYCHNGACITHLLWESTSDNVLRKRCLP